jgi:hypothetical protein
MRLRRQLFAAAVHTTGEARRPITMTVAGLQFDLDRGEARQLAWDLANAIEAVGQQRDNKSGDPRGD